MTLCVTYCWTMRGAERKRGPTHIQQEKHEIQFATKNIITYLNSLLDQMGTMRGWWSKDIFKR